jgi:hypothetical protein
MSRVIIACEFSGVVRRAFRALGHDAWSCDLLPAEDQSEFHIQGDVTGLLIGELWDLMIAHPPCTHLAVSGAPHFHRKQAEQAEALEFVRLLLDAPIPRICLENPVSIISSRIRKPDQIVQPWMFGHAERKTTCLWLKGLPRLTPTSDLKAEMLAKPANKQNPLHYLPPSPERWKLRSTTYPGLALAMAEQWGALDRGTSGLYLGGAYYPGGSDE